MSYLWTIIKRAQLSSMGVLCIRYIKYKAEKQAKE
jgi:hypothetical protein